ncbi:MAG: phosphate acetyltransferase [Deltaproteobacteria bacterium]|nr:phosphate acetyltransferase [Deltaproteobacteria bacterium]MBW1816238.1 phosphate acetyltransferase [Deltaproteobacteria bacterium]MBW2283040.1 phosphate acetyltransferase [Deltaproteobacteria bacterium]
MSNCLYITATEARSGKSLIALGLMETLLRKVKRVAFFRPIITGGKRSGHRDKDIHLIASHFGLDIPHDTMFGCTAAEAAQRLSSGGKGAGVLDEIIRKFNELRENADFILCEGTDFVSSTAAFELDINAEIAKNLGCPVLLVANARDKTPRGLMQSVELALDSLNDRGCHMVATILNRTDAKSHAGLVKEVAAATAARDQLVYDIKYDQVLGKPTVGEIARILDAEILYGADQLNRHARHIVVAAMQLRNFLKRIKHGTLVITPGDRADVILACLSAVSSASMETIAGLLLTGGLKPEKPIRKLIAGFPRAVPILSVQPDTFPTAGAVDRIHATISPDDERKINRALGLFDKGVDMKALGERIITAKHAGITPKMFEYRILQQARTRKRHIVLPEGGEERILSAAESLLRREVVDVTLLGKEGEIREKIDELGLRMDGARIIEPVISDKYVDYARTYYELRKHKRVSEANSRDIMMDVNYFGTMMVYKGDADGMVSGSVHSTAATIHPAFEFIKAKPGISVVSSVFFMCLPDRVLVYGDCAINPDPDARQLAEIAVTSARTAKTFGIEPVVAMLSYSTGKSGSGADVEKVREATAMARNMARNMYPGLEIEGPIQYDAAVDPGVARTKMPESSAAGRATVFIFPDLNTGNNTYKAVQRSAGAVAVGPVLQGLNQPVNDLSRGCTVADIINTVAITAIQAQS